MARTRLCVLGWLRAVAITAALGLAGCEGESRDGAGPCGRPPPPSGFTSARVPILEFRPDLPGGEHVFGINLVAPGGEAEAVYELINTGDAVLAVTGLRWTYEPPDPVAERDAPALRCSWGPDDTPCGATTAALPACVSRYLLEPASGEVRSLPLRVRYRRLDDQPREARLIVHSDNREGDVTLTFRAREVAPRALLYPEGVVFEGGQRGDVLRQPVTVLNLGAADLVVDAIEVEGDPELAASPGAEPLPWTLAPNTSRALEVTLRRDSPAARAGTLRVHTSDPTAPWAEAALTAEPVARRLEVAPEALTFEAVERGAASQALSLRAIGSEPAVISAVRLRALRDGVFRLVPRFDTGLTLAPGEERAIQVVYAPDRDPGGPPDEATIEIESDDWEPRVTVPLTGQVVGRCPQAVLEVPGGTTVAPQTNLHLRGNQSYATVGEIRKWLFSVEAAPAGTCSVFVPSPTFPAPTFEVNLGGAWRFCLAVWDEEDAQSCAPACVDVQVVPDDALHVELLWATPGDEDETDTGPFAGADVDLHVAHPLAPADPATPDRDGDGAPDPWFDPLYDCWWAHPRAEWGDAVETTDDARLDRDDTDGCGPENVNLAAPEDGAVYRVAVHYGEDHEYGPSDATVRIWVRGALAWEGTAPALVRRDLWCVATVAWPSGAVTPCTDEGGGPHVTPDYPLLPYAPPDAAAR